MKQVNKFYNAGLFVKSVILLAFFTLAGKGLFAQINSIILSRPTDTSMTASIIFEQVSDFYFRYGTAPGSYSDSTAVMTDSTGVPMVIDMTNLTANTQYYYTVGTGLRAQALLLQVPSISTTPNGQLILHLRLL